MHLDTHGGPTDRSGHGLIRWLYEGRPGEQRMDLAPVVTVVPFVRQSSGGEYRVSATTPKLSRVCSSTLSPIRGGQWDRRDRQAVHATIFGAPLRDGARRSCSTWDACRRCHPRRSVLLERVETTEAFGTDPITTTLQRYYDADEARVVAVVTIDVSHVDAATSPAIIARFADADEPERNPRMLGEDSFKVAELKDGRRLAQGRVALDPGRYESTVMVVDISNGATGIERSSLVVRPPDDRLRFSDVTWAEALEPLRFASLASYSEAFHVGPYRVLPRTDASFERGETTATSMTTWGTAASTASAGRLRRTPAVPASWRCRRSRTTTARRCRTRSGPTGRTKP